MEIGQVQDGFQILPHISLSRMWKRACLRADCTGAYHCITHETRRKRGMTLENLAMNFLLVDSTLHGNLVISVAIAMQPP